MRELRMMEMVGGSVAAVPYTPTARQERLERAILDSLRASGTRSELRDLVIEFADYLRVRGVGAEQAIGAVRAIGVRATPFMNPDDVAAVGDSASDRITMMVRWCSARYYRAD